MGWSGSLNSCLHAGGIDQLHDDQSHFTIGSQAVPNTGVGDYDITLHKKRKKKGKFDIQFYIPVLVLPSQCLCCHPSACVAIPVLVLPSQFLCCHPSACVAIPVLVLPSQCLCCHPSSCVAIPVLVLPFQFLCCHPSPCVASHVLVLPSQFVLPSQSLCCHLSPCVAISVLELPSQSLCCHPSPCVAIPKWQCISWALDHWPTSCLHTHILSLSWSHETRSHTHTTANKLE